MLHQVIDGTRPLRFEGELLASSSSKSRDPRWVEFYLYKTNGGNYILSRIGVSHYYHKQGCPVIKRNNLEIGAVTPDHIGSCRDCSKLPDSGDLYPEKPRYWVLNSRSAKSVVETLHKYDEFDNRYLTNVARRLLEEAAETDQDIWDAYNNEVIE